MKRATEAHSLCERGARYMKDARSYLCMEADKFYSFTGRVGSSRWPSLDIWDLIRFVLRQA
jgi:hypothetical protein